MVSERRGISVFLLVVLVVCLADGAQAANRYWDSGGTVTNRDWSTGSNWDDDIGPLPADVAYLGHNSYSLWPTVEVTQAGEDCAGLSMGYHVGTTGTLIMTSGDLTVDQSSYALTVGVFGSGTIVQNGGALFVTNGTLSLAYANGSQGNYLLNSGTLEVYSLQVGRAGEATFVQSGNSTCDVTALSFCAYDTAVGTYTMSGGVINATTISVSKGGTLDQVGGTIIVDSLGVSGAPDGRYSLRGGSVTVQTQLAVGTGGTGIMEVETGAVVVCNGDVRIARYSTDDGTLIMKGGIMTGTGNLRLRIYVASKATVRGWGEIGFAGPFNNSGRIIADGSGVDRTLAITNYSAFSQSFANSTTETNGWYAQDHGKLLLEPVTVDSDTEYWGDNATPDLINAVGFSFSGRSGSGTLAGSLYAVDHGDVPAYTNTSKVAAIWRFETNNFTFSSADVTIRFDHRQVADDLDLAETDLKVYSHNGSSWVRITELGLDETNNMIIASNLTSIAWLALAESMENGIPSVDAGTNQLIVLPTNSVTLDATVTDDGFPGGVTNTVWTKIGGSGTVTFGDSNAVDTTATFPTNDIYTLQLRVDDGELVRYDTMQVTVLPASGNNYPVVNPGTNQSVELRSRIAILAGTITDDGLPSGITNALWIKASGPGVVTFNNATNADTVASFTRDGTYVLWLIGNDGELVYSNSVTIEVTSASAVNHYWDDEAGDRNWSSATNWTGNDEPLYVDNVYIGHNSYTKSPTVEVSQIGEDCAALILGYHAGNTGRLEISSGQLEVHNSSYALYLGNQGKGIIVQSGGTLIVTNGTLSMGQGSAGSRGEYHLNGGRLDVSSLQVGRYGLSSFIQTSGSTCDVSALSFCGYASSVGSTYTMSGGVINATTISVSKGGTLDQVGGTIIVDSLGVSGAPDGRYSLRGGSVTVQTQLAVGTGGTGIMEVETGAVVVCNGDVRIARYSTDDGILIMKGGIMTGTGNLRLRTYVASKATVRGWGEIGFAGPFNNSGRIIADGSGVDRTLAITNYSAFSQSFANSTTETNGWYAQNHGMLLLEPVTVDSDTEYWGDNATPDLVNGVQFDFTGRSGSGTLTGSIYAPDREDVPPYVESSSKFTAIWRFETNGFTFSSADLTIRYDATNAVLQNINEVDLKAYYNLGGGTDKWKEILEYAVNTTDKLIIASNVTAAAFIAVGENIATPTAGTVIVIR